MEKERERNGETEVERNGERERERKREREKKTERKRLGEREEQPHPKTSCSTFVENKIFLFDSETEQ